MAGKRTRWQISEEEILREGLFLAREVGLEFSMRQLADRLNTWPNAIYVYFKDKRELQIALIDEIFREYLEKVPVEELLDFNVPWDERFRYVATTLYDHMTDYYRAGYLISHFGMVGTKSGMDFFRALFAIAFSVGLPIERAVAIFHAASTYVLQIIELGSAGKQNISNSDALDFEKLSDGLPDELSKPIIKVMNQGARDRLINGVDAFILAAQTEAGQSAKG
ncbi:MAG: TetR/AcrR family transcriptional regulator [Pseudomonadota bacterium]